MRIILSSVSILAFWSIAYSVEPPDSAAHEECIFDQDAQHEAYLELERKYPGSQYVKDEYKLVIPRDGDQITLRRGGCVHFGISIEFRTAKTANFDEETVFLARVTNLVTEYGQELINLEMLEGSLKNENRHVTKNDTGAYYLLPYPDATFEMFLRHDQEYTTIGVSFYF